jgi:hypothetical protein
VPVESDAELTRVTVGKTAWLLLKKTPSPASRARFGVSSGEMRSGRIPSQIMTTARCARDEE